MTDSDKLRLLADWFELKQPEHPEWTDKEVQDDLRRIAGLLERSVAVMEESFMDIKELCGGIGFASKTYKKLAELLHETKASTAVDRQVPPWEEKGP